jgi:hypothetical protein
VLEKRLNRPQPLPYVFFFNLRLTIILTLDVHTAGINLDTRIRYETQTRCQFLISLEKRFVFAGEEESRARYSVAQGSVEPFTDLYGYLQAERERQKVGE